MLARKLEEDQGNFGSWGTGVTGLFAERAGSEECFPAFQISVNIVRLVLWKHYPEVG